MAWHALKPTLDTPTVDQVLAAARHHAKSLGATFTIAVVDDTTTLRALFRGDRADLLTVGLATGKARLAAANGMPTKQWRRLVAEDPYLGLTVPVALDRLLGGAVLFAGAYPLRVDGTVVGAIGASGGTENQDDDVARAGLTGVPQLEQFPSPADIEASR